MNTISDMPNRPDALKDDLYISAQGSTVRLRNCRVTVENNGSTLLSHPLYRTRTILLFGKIRTTADLINGALDRGVDIVLFTLHGRYRGKLSGPLSGNLPLRRAQYLLHSDQQQAGQLARLLLEHKAHGQRGTLMRHGKNRPKIRKQLKPALKQIDKLLPRFKTDPIDSLMGLEGAVAAAYFDTLAAVLPAKLHFKGRNRRPPLDPLNSCLSFCYSLLTGMFTSLLEARGLDPTAGVLHGERYGRPSLALDLLEPFRPVVDRFALDLLLRNKLKPTDFVIDDMDKKKGCRFTDAGRLKLYDAWDDLLAPPPEADTGLNGLRAHAVALINSFARCAAQPDKTTFKEFSDVLDHIL